MLADGDLIPQQDRVDGACSVCGVVDVVGVDSDEGCSCFDEQFCRVFGQERVTFVILLRIPVTRPVRVHKDSLAFHVYALECLS